MCTSHSSSALGSEQRNASTWDISGQRAHPMSCSGSGGTINEGRRQVSESVDGHQSEDRRPSQRPGPSEDRQSGQSQNNQSPSGQSQSNQSQTRQTQARQ